MDWICSPEAAWVYTAMSDQVKECTVWSIDGLTIRSMFVPEAAIKKMVMEQQASFDLPVEVLAKDVACVLQLSSLLHSRGQVVIW